MLIRPWVERAARMPEKLTGTMFDNTDEQIDMRGLVRLGLWGSAAIGALLLAVMAVQSDTGARRVASGLNADTTGQLAARRQEIETETKRLVESIRTLSSDRDRLLARVTVLERNLEDVTGSVGRIGNAQNAATQSSPLPPVQLPQGPSVITSISAPQTIAAFPSHRVATGHSAARGTAPAPDSVATATDFGVDIGGGPTIEFPARSVDLGQGNARRHFRRIAAGHFGARRQARRRGTASRGRAAVQCVGCSQDMRIARGQRMDLPSGGV